MAPDPCIRQPNQTFLPWTDATNGADLSAGTCFIESSLGSPDWNDLEFESVGHTWISGAMCEALTIFGQQIKAIFLFRCLSGQMPFFLIICMCNCLRVIPAEER